VEVALGDGFAQKVSILVFLDQALKGREHNAHIGGAEVSILVFLDQALKVYFLAVPLHPIQRFNPCFPGSSAERKIGASATRLRNGFQSLFSWIKR